jgi:hypothetical protein
MFGCYPCVIILKPVFSEQQVTQFTHHHHQALVDHDFYRYSLPDDDALA